MNKILGIALVLLLVIGRAAIPGDECCKKTACPAGEKVSRLVESWKAVATEAQGMCPLERGKLSASFTALRESCPVGSRMGETLIFTKAVLDASAAVNPECAKACPAEGKCATGAQAPASETAGSPVAAGEKASSGHEVCKLMQHRSAMASELRDLVTFALAAMPQSGDTAGKPSACGAGATAPASSSAEAAACPNAAAVAASPEADRAAAASAGAAGCPQAAVGKCCGGTGCAKAAETAAASPAPAAAAAGAGKCCGKCPEGKCCARCPEAKTCTVSCCPKVLTAKAQALKASWEKVPGEYASMCPAKKKDLFTTVADLQKSSKVMALLPETVGCLADGLVALDAANTKIQDQVKADPNMLKSVPEELRTRFESQALLVREAKEVLSRVRTAMDAARKEGAFEEPKEGVVLQQ